MASLKFDITGNANGYIRATKQTTDATKRMVGSIQKDAREIDNIFKTLATGAGTFFTMQMASSFVKQVSQVRGEFQQLEVAFETMLQSKEKADALMAQVVDTAARTPFDLQGVANGAKQLLAYGVAYEEVNDTLIRLGDIAAGLSIPLNDLVYLYGTTMTQGRLFTQDLRQFQGRGIPLADELAKQFGVTKNAVGELVTAGKVGFPEVQKAIVAMTSEGGKFNNLMEKQSKTITGQISNLQDAVDQMFNEIGKASEGTISSAISMASSLVENYEKVGQIIGGIVVTLGSYKAATIAINTYKKASIALETADAVAKRASAASTKQVTTATVLLAKAQKALNMSMLSNPYVIAAAAVAALGFGVYALTKHKKAETEAHKAASREVAKEYNEVNTLANKLKDTNAKEEERAKALSRLKEIAPDVVAGIDSEKDSLEKLNEKLGEYNTMKQIEITLKASSQYIDFTESLQSLSDAKAEMQKQKTEIENLWLDLSPKITAAIESGDVSPRLAEYFKEFLYDPNVEIGEKLTKVYDKYWDMNKLRIQYGKNSSYVDEGDFSFMKGLMTESKKDVNDFRLLTTELSDAESDYTTAVEELRKRISNTIALFITDADKAKEAEETMLKALGLADSGSTTTGNGTSEEKALTAKQQENAYKREKAKEKAAERLAKLTRDLNYKVAQADIDSMEDGYAKAIKSLEHNLEVENDTIKDKRAELLKQKEDEALKKWLAEDPENRKEYQFVYKGGLTKEEEAVFTKMGEQAKKMFDKGVADANKKYAGEAQLFIEQLSVDSMLEGSDKDKAQRELDNDKELHDIEAQRDAYIEAARAVWVFNEAKKTGKDAKELVDLFDVDQATKDFNALLEKYKKKQSQQQLDSETEALQNYYIEYGNFKDKLLHLEQQYNDKIAKAKTEGEKKSLTAERDKVLDELKKSQDAAYQNIFKDPTKMSLTSVKNAIKLARDDIKKITSKGTLSEDDIENVQRLQEAVDRLQGYADSAPFAGFGDGLDGVVAKLNQIRIIKKKIDDAEKTGDLKAKKAAEDELVANKEVLKKNLAGVGVDAFANGLNQAAEAMARIAEISGDPQLKQTADIFNGVGNTISGVATGAATGGWIGALVGGLTSILGEVTSAIIESQAVIAEREKVMEDYIDNVAHRARTINDEDYETIFGVRTLEKVVDASEAAKKAWDDYVKAKQEGGTYYSYTNLANETLRRNQSDLASMLVLEGRDPLKSLKALKNIPTLAERFPEIFNAEGGLKLKEAEEVLKSYSTYANEEWYENLSDAVSALRDYEDNIKIVDKYLNSLFSNLGDDIAESILRGEDALETLSDSAGDIFKTISKQFIKELIISDDFITKYKKKWNEIMGSTDYEDGVSKADAQAALIKEMTDELSANVKDAEEFYAKLKQSAEDSGIDMSFDDEERSASSKGTVQASQDSVDQVLGIVTNIQSHTFSIHNDIKQVVNINSQILSSVRNIESNTDRLIGIESDLSQLRSDMSDMATKGIKVRG